MSALTFQFWADVEYQDYDAVDQQFLNSEFRRNPRPCVVHLQGGRYDLRNFDTVECGNAEQVNLLTGFIRHVLLKPVYKLPNSSPVLCADRFRFQYLLDGWLDYPTQLQQQLRAAIQCAPRPAQICFNVAQHSYRLKGLDTLDAAGAGNLNQVNTATGKWRPVRVQLGSSASSLPATCKFDLVIQRQGGVEPLHPEAYARLWTALRASGPRADRVELPSGHAVESFTSLEVGGAGIRCSGEWIPLQLHLPADFLSSQGSGCVTVPDELEVADSDILDHGEFCVLPESSRAEEKVCAICLGELEPDDEGDSNMDDTIFQLRCGHLFHLPCVEEWFKSKQKCPQCQSNFGKVIGDGPRNGRLSWHVERFQLPGHPDSAGTIAVMFDFPPGVDESGNSYAGRRERGYLPANAQGSLLLELFKVALRRRVMFGIGHSMTTGQYRPTYRIHIKTSKQGGAAEHGYPDPLYLKRALEELRSAGVSVADVLRDKVQSAQASLPANPINSSST
mmetsp:Transcript_43712/g.76659  ORF Transcript_43712/g.76659 Transcript_43712/m.76659 type:complete len:505 (+) Transcript_43712:33-1547(+)